MLWLPIELVNDHETHFLNDVIASLLDEFMVIHNMSVLYHPQENGQAKSTKKTLYIVITKLITTTRLDWEMLLQLALCGIQICNSNLQLALHHLILSMA